MTCFAESLAIAIPTRNRPDDLDRTIETVFAQSVLPTQLIIIDQSATDESRGRTLARYESLPPELRKPLELVYVRDTSMTSASAARNRALQAVSAEIVLFLDDDVILECDFSEHILEAYRRHPEAAGVSGIVTNYPPLPAAFRCWTRIFTCGPFWDDRQPIYWRADRIGASAPLKVTRFTGCLMSFPVAAIRAIKFDENLRGACEEDIDFSVQLWPKPLFIAPSARLVHRRSIIGRSQEHWLYKHARANWYLYQRHWSRGFINRLSFIWLNIGYAIACAFVCTRRGSLNSWTDLLKAIRDARRIVSGGRTSQILAAS